MRKTDFQETDWYSLIVLKRQSSLTESQPTTAESVKLAADQKLYAYDAYLIICARDQECGLVSLDTTLARAALAAGVTVIEVPKQ